MAEVGRRRRTLLESALGMRTILSKAVAAKAGEILQEALAKSNPVQGARAIWLAQPGFRGDLHSVTNAAGTLTSLGVRSKKPAAKSSTMKGAKALGSEH